MTTTDAPAPPPLEGLRVVDVGQLVQGPQAAATLADLGADVIKVELPGVGEQARWVLVGPDDRRSAYFTALNRGKRSVTLDLRTDAGRSVLLRLLDTADVLISNFRPGTLDEWGLGWDVLHERAPRLIWAAGSLYGRHGPRRDHEGADLAAQAAGGLISTTGVDGGDPTPVGATIADHVASQNLVTGVLAALYARERTGLGQRVETSLLGGQVWAQAAELTHHALTGVQPARANQGHALIRALYGIFPTADGWVAVVGVPSHLREGFFRALDRPDLAADPRLTSPVLAAEHRAEVFALLGEVFRTRPSAEWHERLAAEHQRYAPVQGYGEVLTDAQVVANGYVMTVEHPEWGSLTLPVCPLEFDATPVRPAPLAPELGQHTEEVLLELGYTWDDLGELAAAGAW